MDNNTDISQHKDNIKEVIFFTYGDSNEASTWSNVPYLFTESLVRHGIIVRRVNLNGFPRWIKRVYNVAVCRVYRLFHKHTSYNFSRSGVFRKLCQRKIKKAVSEFPRADLCIFTNFDFYNSHSNMPTLMFCDWTYEVYIRDRLNREPDRLERRFIRWQNEAMANAEHIVSLFKKSAAQIQRYCPATKVAHLGINVVNDMSHEYRDCTTDSQTLINKKQGCLNILFVGNIKYRNGASCLIDAFNIIRRSHPDAQLHIVGMTYSDLNCRTDNGVTCHGYLRKDNPRENRIYYDLMYAATVFVNPTPVWAGYSSTIEAMYNYTPIIVSPYDDFVEEFSENIKFGLYQRDTTAQSIAESIIRIYTNPDYKAMCESAHNTVSEYNWDNYVGLILEHSRLRIAD